MKIYKLEIDEFAALVGFLNAKSVVGLDEALFTSFTEENLPRIRAKLEAHGWLRPADRPSTYHFNEDLMQNLAVVIAPEFAVLVLSKPKGASILFYLAAKEIVEIIVTSEAVFVAKIVDIDELSAQAILFLKDSYPAEIGLARVKGEGFDAGKRMKAASAVEAGEVAAFLRKTMAELGAKA